MAAKIANHTSYLFMGANGFTYRGTIDREVFEAMARGSYFPATVTRTEWAASVENVGTIGSFPSHAKAIKALMEYQPSTAAK